MANRMAKEYDHLFKLLIIGDSEFGKSALLAKLTDKEFPTNYTATIGGDCKSKKLTVNAQRVNLQIWDIPGQKGPHAITSTYYRGTDGVIIVYDVTNEKSFENVTGWLDEIKRNCEMVNIVLVGNKNEHPSLKVVLSTDAESFAKENEMSIQLFETSAKNNNNVEQMFMAITRRVLETKEIQQRSGEESKGIVHLSSPNPDGNKIKCWLKSIHL